METLMIIGAGPGLAWSVAQRFAQEKWRVVMVARNAERLKGYEKALKDRGVKAAAHVLDVADLEALDKLVRREANDGGVDLLNYNAAVIRPNTPIAETTLDEIRSDMMIDLGGAIVAARAVIPSMSERGRGTIIFSGGDLAFKPWCQMVTLGAAKAGMRNAAGGIAADPLCEKLRVAYVNINAHIVGEVGGKIAQMYYDIHKDRENREWDLHYGLPTGESLY